MVDDYKKVMFLLGCIVLAMCTVLWTQSNYPEFSTRIAHLVLAGDVDGLSDYISSFGYGSIAVSILLLIVCNVFGIPTIPFLTVNGVLFGLVPGLIISWCGEVLGIEVSFHLGRIFFRKEARKFIEQKNMLTKLDKYSSVKHMALARAIPYSPNILFTAMAVLSRLTSREHLRATLVGKVPSVIVEVVLGHDLIYFSEHWMRFLCLLLLVIASWFLHRWHKKKKAAQKTEGR